MTDYLNRRRFLHKTTALGTAAAALTLSADQNQPAPPAGAPAPLAQGQRPYRGPSVVLVRFGGGVRRLETITDAEHTYCPFIYHELARRRGILFNNVSIEPNPRIVTSHGQGTLYILTGRYDRYEDITHRPFADRFEPKVPTIFEYFRRHYDIPPHQALIINGEDRIHEEFYTFSNHHQYGIRYRSTVLSLYRYKSYLLREQIRAGGMSEAELEARRARLRHMENLDYRVQGMPDDAPHVVSPELNAFWRKWREHYGDSGLVNPRGDRLLTTLALWALRELKPRLLMINYQDPDYVHWGNPHFYTRSIAIIDDGLRQIHDATQADEAYRDNTVFLIVPDCGRDSNRAMPVPFQHHFNTRSAHEVFVVAAGPGIAHPRAAVDLPRQHCSVAATVGRIMGFPTPEVDAGAGALQEMLA
ncbi:MAG: hypothetical protein FJ271_11245 [Planctomycetes bacterium]|nr:hypothetical protein [Planctomycetota bacterium]